MRIRRRVFIAAPIDEVFAFFDDPANVVRHERDPERQLERSRVVEVRADGRRCFDLYLRDSHSRWVQTIDQEIREPPRRIVTKGYTWATDRTKRVLIQRTERLLIAETTGTWVEVAGEVRLKEPWRYPFAAIAGWLWGSRDAALSLEHGLHYIAEHLEAEHAARKRIDR